MLTNSDESSLCYPIVLLAFAQMDRTLQHAQTSAVQSDCLHFASWFLFCNGQLHSASFTCKLTTQSEKCRALGKPLSGRRFCRCISTAMHESLQQTETPRKAHLHMKSERRAGACCWAVSRPCCALLLSLLFAPTVSPPAKFTKPAEFCVKQKACHRRFWLTFLCLRKRACHVFFGDVEVAPKAENNDV